MMAAVMNAPLAVIIPFSSIADMHLASQRLAAKQRT
jgi:hypothetical protein